MVSMEYSFRKCNDYQKEYYILDERLIITDANRHHHPVLSVTSNDAKKSNLLFLRMLQKHYTLNDREVHNRGYHVLVGRPEMYFWYRGKTPCGSLENVHHLSDA